MPTCMGILVKAHMPISALLSILAVLTLAMLLFGKKNVNIPVLVLIGAKHVWPVPMAGRPLVLIRQNFIPLLPPRSIQSLMGVSALMNALASKLSAQALLRPAVKFAKAQPFVALSSTHGAPVLNDTVLINANILSLLIAL